MIRIAICDDDDNSIQSCKEIITSMNINDLDMIDSYESGEVFLNEVLVKNVQYDIVILDIDMPGMNGFEVAKKMNEREIDMLIMFYTAHEQYVYKAYEYQPFRYIRKEFAREELPFALKQAIVKIRAQNKRTISINTELEIHIVEIIKIEALEYYKNHVEIFIAKETSYKTRKTLGEVFDEIADDNFIYANKGAVVNLRYIKSVTPTDVILKSGKKIPISRRRYPEVKKRFYKYIGDNL